MDNPQHYQPLSHALHPPLPVGAQYSNFPSGSRTASKSPVEEEEEEEEEEDDEGMVEEQLDLIHPPSNPSSPEQGQNARHENNGCAGHNPQAQVHGQPAQNAQKEEETSPQPKRRPGRPRGSKNRTKAKAAEAKAASAKKLPTFQPPIISTDVNPQNQQYYEFQWRVLNLCAEFYGAAEELVKATPPLVIAQSYQMGPSAKIDPLSMLGEAKRICDTLLANPAQLTTSPPPPMYPQIPVYGSIPPLSAAGPSNASSTASKPANNFTVITNPQTFTMPLGPPVANSVSTPYHTTYAPQVPAPTQGTPASFNIMPYYASTYTGSSYIPISSAAPSIMTAPQTAAQPPSSSSNAGSQGAWTDEEQERLKELAEQSKSSAGAIDWDRVVREWGPTRTRHQILIKATALGLKATSTRGQKRRRDHGPEEDGTPAPTPSTSAAPVGTSTSPPLSQQVSAHPSPAVQHARPASLAPALAWSSPVVAANTPSIIPSSHAPADVARATYYRPRASDKPDSLSSHHYVYHPNGNGKGSGGSKFSKQNGQ